MSRGNDGGRRRGLPTLVDDTRAEEQIGSRDLTRWPSVVGRALVHLVERLSAGVSAHTVLYSTLLIGLVVVTVFAAGGAAIYEAVAERDGISRLDRPVLDAAIAARTATNTRLVTLFTHLGGPVGMPIIASVVTLAMVWRWRSRTPLVLMVIATAGSLLMTSIGKAIVGRPRPPLTDAVPPFEYAFSFPSGHSLNSTVVAGVVAYLLLRRLTTTRARVVTVVLAVAWAGTMGLSRVFLGHHWLTDVAFAWLLGSAWLALIITAHRLFLTVRRQRADTPT